MLPSNPASGHTVNLQAVSNKQHQVFGTATDKEFDGCKRYITALQGLRVDLKEMGAGLTWTEELHLSQQNDWTNFNKARNLLKIGELDLIQQEENHAYLDKKKKPYLNDRTDA